MAKTSAGILLYRWRAGAPQFLLVHPGGPFWARKDIGGWSIPKGEVPEGEARKAAALREFEEELGIKLTAELFPLESVKQKGGKMVQAWAAAGDLEPATFKSNTFEMEWPPRSGRKALFKEIDKVEWFVYEEALN